MNILKALKKSPLGLDFYMWAVYRTFSLTRPASAFLATPVPAVRGGPVKGQRQANRGRLPDGLLTRAQEDQDRLA